MPRAAEGVKRAVSTAEKKKKALRRRGAAGGPRIPGGDRRLAQVGSEVSEGSEESEGSEGSDGTERAIARETWEIQRVEVGASPRGWLRAKPGRADG